MIAANLPRKSTEQNGVADEQKSRLGVERPVMSLYASSQRRPAQALRLRAAHLGEALAPWHFGFEWKGTISVLAQPATQSQSIDSKTAAEGEAEKLRTAIREGKFGQPAPREDMTCVQLGTWTSSGTPHRVRGDCAGLPMGTRDDLS